MIDELEIKIQKAELDEHPEIGWMESYKDNCNEAVRAEHTIGYYDRSVGPFNFKVFTPYTVMNDHDELFTGNQSGNIHLVDKWLKDNKIVISHYEGPKYLPGHENDDRYRCRGSDNDGFIVFCFKTASEALHFKLTWQGYMFSTREILY
jgi:hypothetical protein